MLISDFIIFPFHWFCSFLVSLVQELYSQEKYKYRISPVSFPRLKSPLQAGWCSFSQRQSRKADKRGEHSLTQNATKEKKYILKNKILSVFLHLECCTWYWHLKGHLSAHDWPPWTFLWNIPKAGSLSVISSVESGQG